MVRMQVTYQGDKHCELIHEPSQSRIETDAPKDNNGRGERFSPTDLMGAALGSCILTVMAIMAERDNIDLRGARASVEKEMYTNPRRISKLIVNLHMPAGVPRDYRKKLELAANTCPVHRSLHPEIESPIIFHFPD